MKNWKTSLSGIASIISGVALFLNRPEQISESMGLVAIGFGLLFARDHDSKDIGGGGFLNPPKP
jgi:hypothetical protein